MTCWRGVLEAGRVGDLFKGEELHKKLDEGNMQYTLGPLEAEIDVVLGLEVRNSPF